MDQLKWQRLTPFDKLADMLLKHLDGILNYCRTKVRFGVVEAVNANLRLLINRGRGYKNLRYLLLKAKRLAAANPEFVAGHRIMKAAVNGHSDEFLRRAIKPSTSCLPCTEPLYPFLSPRLISTRMVDKAWPVRPSVVAT